VTAALLGFVFALAESGLGLGAIIPGEVAISSLAASVHGTLPILVLGAGVALGATAGDHLGLVVGRVGGVRLRESRLIVRIGVDRWDRAASLVQRHGFWAVLGSRVLPLVRTVMPVVAGAAGLRYRSFLAASLIGAIGWSAVWVGAGAGIGASGLLDHPWLIAGAAAVVVAAILTRSLVRRLRSPAPPAEAEEPALEAVCSR
jgi:membrane-associated protein